MNDVLEGRVETLLSIIETDQTQALFFLLVFLPHHLIDILKGVLNGFDVVFLIHGINQIRQPKPVPFFKDVAGRTILVRRIPVLDHILELKRGNGTFRLEGVAQHLPICLQPHSRASRVCSHMASSRRGHSPARG